MGLLIKNGTIVSSTAEYQADLLIEDEKIKEIAVNIPEGDHEVVDAAGKYIFPGGVDEHVHMGPFDSYGFETSHAALVGGTTTIVDFAPQDQGDTVINSFHRHKDEKAKGIASPDFSFHGMVMDTSEALLDEIPKMVENGIVNLKFFMAYNGTPFHVEDDLIFKAMQICKDYGITPWVHCENGDMIEVLKEEAVKNGVTKPIGHYLSSPPTVEDEAVQRLIYLAKLADCPVFIVHNTTEGACENIKRAQDQGQPVYGETCTHYLTIDTSFLEKENFEGAKWVCGPAIRPKEHLDAVWKAVKDGTLMGIGSDHAACVGGFEKAKKRGIDDFTKIPNGVPGMQDRLNMVWTQGVEKGRINRQDFVRLCMENPAKVCGIYPQKGALLPGSDADVLIWDPNYEGTISVENSYEGTDYNTFEGFPQKGIADKVFLRGHLMAERGKLVGEKGQGQYVKPQPYTVCYSNYHQKKAE